MHKGLLRYIKIFIQKPAIDRGGASEVMPPLPLAATLHIFQSVNISFKDDVTVILLLGVSFMYGGFAPPRPTSFRLFLVCFSLICLYDDSHTLVSSS